MGLFDKFKKAAHAAEPAKPEPVAAEEAHDVLCAPCSGKIVAMSEVPDPVFSHEVLGKGCAIWPDDGVVYAPVSGKVTVTMGHAIGVAAPEDPAVGVKSESGIEILIHVGIDTVDMNGNGFTTLVDAEKDVRAGEPILRFDRKAIADAGHPDVAVMAVSNTDDFASVEMLIDSQSQVRAGQAVVRVQPK